MPYYKHIVMCLPKYPVGGLTTAFRKVTEKVFECGGIVRAIENHGVRELSEKTTRKYADAEGKKSFWYARYVTISLDISPKGLAEVNKVLDTEDCVLRVFTMKKSTIADRLESRNFRMPFKQLEFPKY